MIFSYNWLKQYIKGKMPGPENIVKILMFHSFEIEGLEKKGRDFVIDIDVLPNRAHDCLSHIGVARDLAAVAGLELKLPEAVFTENKDLKVADFLKVTVKNNNDCHRYTARIIRGVKVGASPRWMQEKLEACGLQAINNIVDITNYVMLETGQPIHAFDADKLGKKIVIRRARQGEAMQALDDKKYKLDKSILVVADAERPVAIAGIKGGEKTGIDKKTKNVVIEAGNWNPIVTRLASQKLKLRTDASWRFENSPDPNLIDFAQDRVASLIQEITGGEVVSGMIDVYPKKKKPKKIKLDLGYVESLLGVRLAATQPKRFDCVKNILERLGFEVESTRKVLKNQIMVTVPTRRVDVSIPENLVEEIGRVYGYENIPSVFPSGTLEPPKRNDELFWENNIKDILKEAGFCEAYGYSFVGDTDKDVFNWPQSELVEIANPVSSLNKYLRPSLIINLTKAAKENLKNFDAIRMFEVGSIFKKQSGFKEKRMLTGILTGKSIKDDGFYMLKGAVEDLFNKLGISDIWYDNIKPTPEDSKKDIWHPGKTAELKSGDTEIGFLGQLHPAVTGGLNIKEKVFLFDIDAELLLRAVSEEHEYRPISPYPAVLRDVALLAPLGTKTVDILNVINSAGAELVRDVDLFDVYSGEAIGEGRENFAFHIVYQSEKKTLSSQEVDRVHQEIVKALEANPGWEVRK